MADDPAAVADLPEERAAPRRRRFPVARAIGALLVFLALLVAAVGLGVDTDAGHRFIIDRVAELKPESAVSKAYVKALENVLDHRVRLLIVVDLRQLQH